MRDGYTYFARLCRANARFDRFTLIQEASFAGHHLDLSQEARGGAQRLEMHTLLRLAFCAVSLNPQEARDTDETSTAKPYCEATRLLELHACSDSVSRLVTGCPPTQAFPSNPSPRRRMRQVFAPNDTCRFSFVQIEEPPSALRHSLKLERQTGDEGLMRHVVVDLSDSAA
jgi:hypothetical protein